MTEFRFAGRWTPEDRRMALYRRLPFDLPTDATGLVIEIDYAKTATAAPTTTSEAWWTFTWMRLVATTAARP